MNAEVPGDQPAELSDANAEPSASADLSGSEKTEEKEPTAEERFELELAMERRARYQGQNPDGKPPMSTISQVTPGLLAGIQVLPNQLAQALRHAEVALHNARKDAKRRPGPVSDQNVRVMERQLARVLERVKAHRPGNGTA